MARKSTSDRIVLYRWQRWEPNYEPVDNELVRMTDQEFDTYEKAIRKYAMTRQAVGFQQ